jgi:AmmeMemoRadiSam system protein A
MTTRKAGVFVSLKKHGSLRGCIGTISPVTDSIAEEILRNAVSSGLEDPRFPPLAQDELPELIISVDVLGEPEPISSTAELDVVRYGVIVSSGRKRGLLLPNLENVNTVEEQVAIARKKAGIYDNEVVRMERFEVVRHK